MDVKAERLNRKITYVRSDDCAQSGWRRLPFPLEICDRFHAVSQGSMMLTKSLRFAAATIALAGAAPVFAQGVGHSWFMRGTIVGSDNTGTVVCIGKADGAEVGQTLEVYRVETLPGPSKGTAANFFQRKKIGNVRIDHVFDEHFAHVTVIDGQPAKNDVVELRRNH